MKDSLVVQSSRWDSLFFPVKLGDIRGLHCISYNNYLQVLVCICQAFDHLAQKLTLLTTSVAFTYSALKYQILFIEIFQNIQSKIDYTTNLNQNVIIPILIDEFQNSQ